ncbi:MAG: efflux RND transporter periplasmic adaptor subunit, partial [Actinomycetota bacterium]
GGLDTLDAGALDTGALDTGQLGAGLDPGALDGLDPGAFDTGGLDAGLDIDLGGLLDGIDAGDLPNPAEPIVAELDAVVRPAIAEAREGLPEALAELETALADLQVAIDEQRATLETAIEALPPETRAELGLDGALPEVTVPPAPTLEEANAALDALEEGYETARQTLLEAGAEVSAGQAELVAELAGAAEGVAAQLEATLASTLGEVAGAQAQAAQAVGSQLDGLLAGVAGAQQEALSGVLDAQVGAQEEAVAAARDEQEAELDAAAEEVEERREDLEARAPRAGLVELADGAAGGGAPDLGGLGGLGGLGDLGGGLGGLGDLGGGLEGLGDAAPEGGVDDAPIEEGSEVSAGQPLFTVYDLSDWYIEAAIDELDARGVAAGQSAEVTLDAFPGEVFEGVVDSVALTPSGGGGGAVSYPTRIRLLDRPPEPGARIGMSAGVEIATASVEAEEVVPSTAVVRRDDSDAVYVLDGDTVEIVPVEVLAFGDEAAAVEGDLAAGDVVLTAGYEDLPDGAEVRVGEGDDGGDDEDEQE